MFCEHCGNKLPKDTKFCDKCGAKVVEGTIPTVSVSKGSEGFPAGIFVGRLSRLNYFIGLLFAILPVVLLLVLWGLITFIQNSFGVASSLGVLNTIVIPLLIGLGVIWFLLLTLGLSIRRSHDFGYTGWLVLLYGILGGFAVFVFLIPKSDVGSNEYGPAPVKGRKLLANILNY